MDVPVGIGRTIVEQIDRVVAAGLAQLLVEAVLLPAGQDLGLTLGQPPPHWKLGTRQIQGFLEVHNSKGRRSARVSELPAPRCFLALM